MRKFFVIVALLLLMNYTVQAQDGSTPTPQPQPSERMVRVWWPDTIYPREDDPALQILDDQLNQFNQTNLDYEVVLRLKPQAGTGGILNTLTAAQPIAASALPDLVLLPHDDLVTAVRVGVIRQIEDWVPDTIRTDLLSPSLQLGQVDGLLYGLPYALTVEHLIYDPTAFQTDAALSLEDVLNGGERWWLPLNPLPNYEVSDIVLAQYVSAGGRLVDEGGVPILDQEPLLEVLAFYEQGIEAGLFAADLLTLTHYNDYWETSEVSLAMIDSTLYLQTTAPLEDFKIQPIPLLSQNNQVVLNGWVWALVATDPEQQMGALQFIEFMMSAETHADFTQSLGVLPSRRRTLRIWSDNPYIQEVERWLASGITLPTEVRNNLAAEQLQLAVMAVLNGMGHEEAAQNARAALSSSG